MTNKLVVGNQTIHFTVHALDRYRERVKPSLSRDGALSDLITLSGHATIGGAPDWTEDSREGLLATSIDTWLFYGPDIAFPINDRMAITCVTRGTISDITREARKVRKRANKEQERHRRRHGPNLMRWKDSEDKWPTAV